MNEIKMVNTAEIREELFKKIKCKPTFGCWLMGCRYEDNPKRCPDKIWECKKCGSENLKLPPKSQSPDFDCLYHIYKCKDCGHENIR